MRTTRMPSLSSSRLGARACAGARAAAPKAASSIRPRCSIPTSFDSKKKLKGEREPLFPERRPGHDDRRAAGLGEGLSAAAGSGRRHARRGAAAGRAPQSRTGQSPSRSPNPRSSSPKPSRRAAPTRISSRIGTSQRTGAPAWPTGRRASATAGATGLAVAASPRRRSRPHNRHGRHRHRRQQRPAVTVDLAESAGARRSARLCARCADGKPSHTQVRKVICKSARALAAALRPRRQRVNNSESCVALAMSSTCPQTSRRSHHVFHHRHRRPPQCRQIDAVQPPGRPPPGAGRRSAGRDARPARGRRPSSAIWRSRSSIPPALKMPSATACRRACRRRPRRRWRRRMPCCFSSMRASASTGPIAPSPICVRKSGKPAILVANKSEGRAGAAGALEAFALGLGDPVAISAEHGEGLADLYDALARGAAARRPSRTRRG